MRIRDVLAFNLRKYRNAAKLSQEELAYRAKIDRTYISAVERSVYSASVDVVDRLANVLGIEAADLLIRPSRQSSQTKSPKKATRSNYTQKKGADKREVGSRSHGNK
jgi:transcriptional regulator with XRE-family HTH domain